jgi:thioredoxin 1
MALEITDKNFEEVLQQKEITLIDFWAEWCGPCKMLGPVIDELSKDNAENLSVVIGKANVDDNKELAFKYGIRSIPTMIFFKNGEMVDKLVGFKNKVELQTKINSLLN